MICWMLGLIAYLVLGRERRRVRARLAAGLGAPQPERRVVGAFVRAGVVLADMLALLDPAERADRTLELDPASRATFRSALAEGRGVVFVSAHLGSWERMAAVLAADGFPVHTVARASYDPRLTAIYERIRRPRGVRSIYRGSIGAVRAIARALHRGEAVGFLIDLPARVPSIGCRLFGEDSPVALGAAEVALSRGAPVLVGTPAPGPGRAQVQVTRIPTAEDEPSVGLSPDRLTELLAIELGRRIAAHPEAWLGLFAPARTLPLSQEPR
jgi:KDO2-lipid IV(A) lauroyltransferase